MNHQNFTSFTFLLLPLFIAFSLVAQDNNLQVHHETSQELSDKSQTYSNIYLYYPLDNSAGPLSVFLNKKNIGKITNGGRLECRLLFEGTTAITLIEGFNYKEPLTQSKNSRTITIAKGKSYYFKVYGNGVLEYILSTSKGQDHFANTKDFNAEPASFIEMQGSNIPPLQPTTK